MSEDVSNLFKVPGGDQPVAALINSSITPSKAEVGPKDPFNHRDEFIKGGRVYSIFFLVYKNADVESHLSPEIVS